MKFEDQELDFDREEAPPVDMLAALFDARGWQIESTSEEEVSAYVKGNWTRYQLRAIWQEEDNVLQLLVLPDIRIPDDKKPAICETLALINEQVWLGHFELWSDGNILLFRHAMMLPANGLLGVDQTQTIIDMALDEWERFYPVFQFVLWSDKSPAQALADALVDIRGEA